jgi:hypothetical protein
MLLNQWHSKELVVTKLVTSIVQSSLHTRCFCCFKLCISEPLVLLQFSKSSRLIFRLEWITHLHVKERNTSPIFFLRLFVSHVFFNRVTKSLKKCNRINSFMSFEHCYSIKKIDTTSLFLFFRTKRLSAHTLTKK